MNRERSALSVAPASANRSRSVRLAGRRFRQLFSVTVAVLVLLVAGLAMANFSQGPRLASAEINPLPPSRVAMRACCSPRTSRWPRSKPAR
ncbi:hypothetical protein E3T40_00955 [Cryobacterium sp. TMT1-19]|uniref:hypothetical protein n=1 Tax=Cryobacterium sp. TMT1-19 TaxID=1259231 RepID=UPI00106AE2F9|nr:hypothetical protein [Cryobacterium sp. TMT1-19]TFD39655.1 hypothetical protein E3T40_00955 [Cryobacterium sp. TMT1-19]